MAKFTCPVCGAQEKKHEYFNNILSDETFVCEKCAAKTRFLYPVELLTDSEGDPVMKNPVKDMTLEKFKAVLEETDQKRAAEISAYDGFRGVIMVDTCYRTYHINMMDRHSGRYFKEMKYYIQGRVLFGEISKNDVLHVKRKEREETVTVKKLQNAPAGTRTFDADTVYEGSYICCEVPEEASYVYSGDILYKV